MTERHDFAALIGSRICHDLISPIGAIGNGVELMLMDGGAKTPELALISESVAHANARIRFFRIAFGAAGDEGRIARLEVQSILDELGKGSRLRIGWSSGSEFARREAKLAFLAIQCMETAMPWGGQVSVAQAGARWTVTGEAPRLKIDAPLWEALSVPRSPVEITPALVHFALLPAELQARTRRLVVEIEETRIRLSF
jgi:histidine phosphotransferase ChpT